MKTKEDPAPPTVEQVMTNTEIKLLRNEGPTIAVLKDAARIFGIIYAEWQGPKSDIEIVRVVLEAAQQEAEAREVIERWKKNLPLVRHYDFTDLDGQCTAALSSLDCPLVTIRAAAWCRAELAK